MSFLGRLLGDEPLFARETASAGAPPVGNPNTSASFQDDKSGAMDLGAQTGPAGERLKAARKAIPAASSLDNIVKVVKQVRSQYQVRPYLENVADFMTDGFRIKPVGARPEELDAFLNSTGIYQKVWRAAFELVTLGWCVIYASEDEKTLPGLTVLHNVTIRRGVDGTPHVYLQLSDQAKSAIKANSKNYPKDWQKQLGSSNGVDITRVYDKGGKLVKGGAYFITLEPDGEDIFPVAPLYPALASIMDTERLSDAAGAVIDFVKYYMLHAKLGNDKGQDERTGRIEKVSTKRVDDTKYLLSAGFKTGAIVSPRDVTVEHVVPEIDPLSGATVPEANRFARMKSLIGVPAVEESKNAAAAAYILKEFMPRIDRVRQVLMQQFVEPFLRDMASRYSFMENTTAIWGLHSVQDLGALINRAKFQMTTGACSMQYLNELVDPDFDLDREMARKEYEKGFKDTAGMLWEASSGLSAAALEAEANKQDTAAPVPDASSAPDPNADQGGRPNK